MVPFDLSLTGRWQTWTVQEPVRRLLRPQLRFDYGTPCSVHTCRLHSSSASPASHDDTRLRLVLIGVSTGLLSPTAFDGRLPLTVQPLAMSTSAGRYVPRN